MTVFKWIVALVLLGLGCKVLLSILSTLTVGMALATIAMWGAGAFVLGAGAIYVTVKILSSKKKS